jgi:nitrogen fixation NifU-like protein
MTLSSHTLYKEILLDHYRKPRNHGNVSDCEVVRRGSNPRCGDELEIGINFDGDTLREVKFHGRGCSVCLASASMMTEAVIGNTREESRRLYTDMKAWFSGGEGDAVADPPETLRALHALREYPARRRCVLLAWEALDSALEDDGQ